jgi:hypothetical protein
MPIVLFNDISKFRKEKQVQFLLFSQSTINSEFLVTRKNMEVSPTNSQSDLKVKLSWCPLIQFNSDTSYPILKSPRNCQLSLNSLAYKKIFIPSDSKDFKSCIPESRIKTQQEFHNITNISVKF